MPNENRKNTFIMQAAILAGASLLVRFIGFLYRLPLTGLIGDEGNAIYSAGYYIYTFLLILSSAGLPAAISKLVSERIALKQYRNAHRVFTVSLIIAGTAGFVGMVLLLGFAQPIANAVNSPRSYYALMTLAPTLFIVGIMSAYRGYFQGMKSMMPTAISQVVEQVFNAVFSVYLAWLLVGKDIALGAAGGTAGTGIGALAGLIIVMVSYHIVKPDINKKLRREPEGIRQESKAEICKIIMYTAIPIIAGTAVFSMTNLIDMKMVMSRLLASGAFTQTEAEILYGQLSGKYVVLTTFPVSISTAMATAAIPNIAAAVTLGNKNEVKRKINMTLKLVMTISIPAAVGIGVLGDQILQMLYPAYPEGGMLLKVGSVSIIFLALCQIVTGALQGIGKIKIPVVGAILGAIVKVILNYILIINPKINVLGAVISTIACYFIAAAFNLYMLSRSTKVVPDFMGILIKPIFASIVMGAGCIGFYQLFFIITKNNTLSTLMSVVFGILIFGIIMILIKGLEREDILVLPMGRKILGMIQKCGFMCD